MARTKRLWLICPIFCFTIVVTTFLGGRLPAESAPTQSDSGALAIWRKSVTVGEDLPMRADMTMTVRRHGIVHTIKAHVVQGSRGRYRMEYLEPKEARGRIVFSDSHTNWQYEPARNLLERTELPVPTLTDDRSLESLIEANYQITLVPNHASSAGRSCYLLDLLPRHSGKSRQRRWIDKATYKTLRLETHYVDGILARMVTYYELDLPAVITESDFLPMQNTRIHTVSGSKSEIRSNEHSLAGAAESLGLRASAALGFTLVQVSDGPLNDGPATQLLYSDGIETLSVFVQANAGTIGQLQKGWSQFKVKNTPVFQNIDGHLNTLVWTMGGRRYTAVSHLVPAALQAVVESEL